MKSENSGLTGQKMKKKIAKISRLYREFKIILNFDQNKNLIQKMATYNFWLLARIIVNDIFTMLMLVDFNHIIHVQLYTNVYV